MRLSVQSALDGSGPPVESTRPKSLRVMVDRLVFLGLYQILLAWRFGTFFKDTNAVLRHYYGDSVWEPVYATTGVIA
jgi:hypothetical protein